ncbi:MAG: NADP-reducing hydrogenase subunit HndC [Dehalococcoidia bacterium]|nr:NADP-reducing hydrogenase subunit HndC [Bacillota bacterium]
MSMINLIINNQAIEVEPDTTILEAAAKLGIKIPTLCYLPELRKFGACRICVVEDARGTLVPACYTPVKEGMVLKTASPKTIKTRKTILELLLASHNGNCLICDRNGRCTLQTMAYEMDVREIRFKGAIRDFPMDASGAVIRDPNKCILCGNCVRMCHEVQTVGTIDFTDRGFTASVATAFDKPIIESNCIFCGQCVLVCPVAALVETSEIEAVKTAIASDKHVVVQVAPAVRVSLGEEFGLEPGTLVTGKIVAALRRLGFDKIFDTQFTADLTIMEEGAELLHRIKDGGALPMFTSCSPAWIKFCEQFYPELLPNVSTCKSPQEMFGAIAKTYYAEKSGIDPKDIFVVSIMPCTAKKYEKNRPEMKNEVDAVLTTRELAKMIKQAGIEFKTLPDEDFDSPLGQSTGAGTIFGVTGGMMEATLRTVYAIVTEKELEGDALELTAVRGLEGIREATIPLGDLNLKVAVTTGLGNARVLLDKIKAGEADYHLVEIMPCSGGCINGGGQPYTNDPALKEKRAAGLYESDRSLPLRKSHLNPAVQKAYQEYFGKPNSHKAHEILHTHYHQKPRH